MGTSHLLICSPAVDPLELYMDEFLNNTVLIIYRYKIEWFTKSSPHNHAVAAVQVSWGNGVRRQWHSYLIVFTRSVNIYNHG